METCHLTYESGQVWRWHCSQPGLWEWDELWLLLSNLHKNDEAWDAINLETGEFDTIYPVHLTIDWELVT